MHPSYALRARLRWRFAASAPDSASLELGGLRRQDLLPRALGILRLSSLAQNPGFQRLRKRFFYARKRVRRQSDTRHAQQ